MDHGSPVQTRDLSSFGRLAGATWRSLAGLDRSNAGHARATAAVLLGLLLLLTCVYAWYGATQKTGYVSGDQWRYLWYAENLHRGYYSPPDYVFLWGGPGYPLFLLPFVAAGASVATMQAANGVLLGLAQLCFFSFVRQYASVAAALVCTAALALYLPVLDFVPLTYTEPLAFTLLSALLYFLSRAVRGSWAHIIGAGLAAGWLVLTKVAFWPQIFAGCAICAGLCLWYRWRQQECWRAYRNLALALLVAIACCVPYLLYTKRVTGRTFYWGAGTGSILYWISNPHGNHYGEWYHPGWVERLPELRRHHYELMASLGGYDKSLVGQSEGREKIARSLAPVSSPEADDVLKQAGIANIKAHPGIYLRNVGYNALRLLFDWPSRIYKFSAASKRMAVCTSLTLLGVAYALVRLAQRRVSSMPIALFALWLFVTYLGLLSLVSAVGRYFVTIAPAGLALFALAAAPDIDRWLKARSARQIPT